MRNLLKTLAVALAAVPALASAAITDSKHDLSSLSDAAVKSAASDQTCIFCHTPHKASTSLLLWNHRLSANASQGWAAATTLAGTTLPATVGDASKRCLSCHDGTVALGDVMNSSGAAAIINVDGGGGAGGDFMTAASTIGATGLETNHPVSVPYPAGAGGNAYGGITSEAKVADFRVVLADATCTSTTGICTTAPVAADGQKINLYGTAAAPGIECGSCHEVHNKYGPGNQFFLRVSQAQSAICIACHVK
jgi:hypothetical protein